MSSDKNEIRFYDYSAVIINKKAQKPAFDEVKDRSVTDGKVDGKSRK